MRTVVLQRGWADDRATLGMLSVLGEIHDPIFTLENPLRKTPQDSRIPGGEYNCIPYSGTKHKDVYELQNVPGRTAILIHIGNYEKDTEGCILIGQGSGLVGNQPMITGSALAMENFKKIMGAEEFKILVLERYSNG